MHGGDIYKYIEEYGKEPLDFSANVNPYPLPREVESEIQKSIGEISHYPDPDCTRLRTTLAEKLKVDRENILCGAGASDLIYRFVCALLPKKTLIIEPAFSEYESALKLYDCEIYRYFLKEENDFKLTDDILGHITKDIDLIILNNPHNPSGTVIDAGLLQAIVKYCRKHGVYILCDESFIDFLEGADERSIIHFGYDKVISIRAFTKYYGLAGVRLGYAVSSDHELLHKMKNSGPTWNVSVLAQAAGIGVLEAGTDIREAVRKEREYLYDELTALGFYVIKSHVNFLLFFSEDEQLFEKLMERGILIRDCSDFTGLKKDWYRVAVRMHTENAALIEAMESISKL